MPIPDFILFIHFHCSVRLQCLCCLITLHLIPAQIFSVCFLGISGKLCKMSEVNLKSPNDTVQNYVVDFYLVLRDRGWLDLIQHQFIFTRPLPTAVSWQAALPLAVSHSVSVQLHLPSQQTALLEHHACLAHILIFFLLHLNQMLKWDNISTLHSISSTSRKWSDWVSEASASIPPWLCDSQTVPWGCCLWLTPYIFLDLNPFESGKWSH